MRMITALVALTLAAPAVAKIDIGMNMSACNYYSQDAPWIDLTKCASTWSGTLNAAGYPGSTAASVGQMIPMEDVRRSYTVTKKGSAALWLSVDGKAQPVHTEATFTDTALPWRQGGTTIAAGYGALMALPTNLADPITSITVARSEYAPLLAQGQIVAPDFVAKFKPFAVLRFMDWMTTNGATDGPRPRLADRSWAGPRGIPIEAMGAVLTATGKGGWFNVPHYATDTQVIELFDAIKASAKTTGPIYIEYSNEVWNGQFAQSKWAAAQAVAKWGAGTPVARWTGFRTGQIAALARSYGFRVVGGVQPVLPAQATAWWQGYVESGAQPADMGGWIVTVYINGTLTSATPDVLDIINRGDLDAAFVNLRTAGNGSVKGLAPFLKQQGDIAKAHGIPLIAYESNLHLNVNGLPDVPKAIAFMARVQADPRAGDVMSEALDAFEAAGGTLAMMFGSSGPGQSVGGGFGLTTGLRDNVGLPVYQMAVRRTANVAPQPAPTGTTLDELRDMANRLAAGLKGYVPN
jgi:hypothetical protein